MLSTRTAEQIEAEARAAATARRRAEARAFLAETDWYAVRLAETGQPIPAPVSEAREAARALLSSEKG